MAPCREELIFTSKEKEEKETHTHIQSGNNHLKMFVMMKPKDCEEGI